MTQPALPVPTSFGEAAVSLVRETPAAVQQDWREGHKIQVIGFCLFAAAITIIAMPIIIALSPLLAGYGVYRLIQRPTQRSPATLTQPLLSTAKQESTSSVPVAAAPTPITLPPAPLASSAPLRTTPPPARLPTPPAVPLIVGPRSQFNIRGGQGACGTCACHFAIALLRNDSLSPDSIDRLLAMAVAKHGETVRVRRGGEADAGTYLSFDECLEYSNLGQRLEIVPNEIRQRSRLEYGDLLDALVTSPPTIRVGVLTIAPYSMAIKFDPDSSRPWSIFDSHGFGGIGANLRTFVTQGELIEHLTDLFPFNGQTADTTCTLEPMRLLGQ